PAPSRPLVLHGKPVGRFVLLLEDSSLSALRGAALTAITVSGILALGLLFLIRRREFRAEEIHEQRRLRDETEKRSEGLARIVSGVAHEIRNPLNTLSLGLDSLHPFIRLIPPGNGSDAERRLDMLQQTVLEANGLVQNLLQTTRPILPHPRSFDVEAWLGDIHLAFTTAFFQTRLVTEAPAGVSVVSDPDLLRRLVWNLVANAAQAGSSTVRLSLADGPRSLMIRISDDGPGLPTQAVEHLFMAGNTTRPDGTGLGLYNAFRLAIALGGKLELAGTGSSGTTFDLSLPSQEPAAGGSNDSIA
ncbi:MAG TPA: HAMP domain-containing sensor histidine kinase, partial [Candidatus Ozemobacteraceae bacterium]|nr:HAMP domain-containing sensor histidine kinase [Candidatus Ozemobacteraceae bacterium]